MATGGSSVRSPSEFESQRSEPGTLPSYNATNGMSCGPLGPGTIDSDLWIRPYQAAASWKSGCRRMASGLFRLRVSLTYSMLATALAKRTTLDSSLDWGV